MRSRQTSSFGSARFLCVCLFVSVFFAGCGGGGVSSVPRVSGNCDQCFLPNLRIRSASDILPNYTSPADLNRSDGIPELHWPVQRGVAWRISLAYNDPPHLGALDMAYALDFKHFSDDPLQTGGKGVLAAADGIVVFASDGHNGYGRRVDIDHENGWGTRYAHLESMFVQVNDRVTAHQPIGLIGSTGVPPGYNPHLHFELRTVLSGAWLATHRPEPIEGATDLTKGYSFWHDLPKTLFRYRNAANGDYLYTTNFGELGNGAGGWVRETDMGHVWANPSLGSTRVYRYYNQSAGRHFYTTDFNELGNGNPNTRLESETFYVYSHDPGASVGPPGAVKMHRYYNSSTGVHFYTIDWNELGGGWGPWALEYGGWWQLP